MLKNKFKIILVMVISLIITSGLSVYATYNYFAKDVSYTKSDGTEINVEQALNEIYSNMNKNLELVAVVNGGKNATSTSSSPVLTYQNLEAGNYLVVITTGRRNNDAVTTTNNNTTSYGTLSGFTTSKVAAYAAYGKYYESTTTRANIFTNIFECSLEDTATITYTGKSTTDDSNVTMIILKR